MVQSGHSGAVKSVAFSPDGRQLIALLDERRLIPVVGADAVAAQGTGEALPHGGSLDLVVVRDAECLALTVTHGGPGMAPEVVA